MALSLQARHSLPPAYLPPLPTSRLPPAFPISRTPPSISLQGKGEGKDEAGKPKARVLLPFVQELSDTVMIIVMWIVGTTPIAVGCLILNAFGANSLEELGQAMSSLGIVQGHTVVHLPLRC